MICSPMISCKLALMSLLGLLQPRRDICTDQGALGCTSWHAAGGPAASRTSCAQSRRSQCIAHTICSQRPQDVQTRHQAGKAGLSASCAGLNFHQASETMRRYCMPLPCLVLRNICVPDKSVLSGKSMGSAPLQVPGKLAAPHSKSEQTKA